MTNNRRLLWKEKRAALEEQGLRRRPFRTRLTPRIDYFRLVTMSFKGFAYMTGLIIPGRQNARRLTANTYHHFFPDLPAAFEGFSIAHLTDLHLDDRPDMVAPLVELLRNNPVDCAVFTGDFASITPQCQEQQDHLKTMMHEICEAITAPQGIYGVLGNHDSHRLVDILADLPLEFLINETKLLEKKGQTIQLLGTDDVHYFFDQMALDSLESCQHHFTVGLIHSPELAVAAQEKGMDLYLCGHTHGGQICLPGGIGVIKRIRHCRDYYKGEWNHLGMKGHTSEGIGTSGVHVRFNTSAEVAIHILHRGEA